MNVLRICSFITHVQVISFITILNRATSKSGDDLFCSCQKDEIKCKGIQDISILQLHFSLVKNCSATELRISNSQLLALPNEMLNGTSISKIRIDNTYLPFLAVPIGGENPFLGGNLVVKFTVEMVQYPYNWKWDILNACENLQKLQITKSDMIYVGPTFKKLNLRFLEHLSIQNSGVRWIHDKAFASLKKLAFLNFQNNYVKNFKRSLLPDPALYLSVINFRSNLLEFLEEDFFKNMPILTYVNIEYNNLVTLSEFKNMKKRFFINLAGNPFRCDCSIEWLNDFIDQTDSYRLRCFDPQSNGSSVLVKKFDWDRMDC